MRIPVRGNPEPGRYSLERTPYWREPLEACGQADPHTHINVMSTPQTGKSQFTRCAIGYWVDTSTDPILLVFPTQDACEEQLDERVVPMIRETPQLARWLTGRARDVTIDQIALAHVTIYAAWASSPQALASRPIGKVVLDEVDKYLGSAKEADPEALAEHRTNAYPTRKKILAISTPTTKDGTIWRLFRQSRDRRRWHLACPHCGDLVHVEWSHFRWDRQAEVDPTDEDQGVELVDQLEVGDARAWVLCPSCEGEIHEHDRLDAVLAGEWRSEGFQDSERPRSKRVAYHVPAWLSPWVTFADVVGAWITSQHTEDPRNFHNGYLALPSEEISGTVDADVFTERADAQPFDVPLWATAVTAGADTQVREGKAFWRYVVRAYGKNNLSQLVTFGRADSMADLLAATIDASFTFGTRTLGADLIMIDSGGGTESVDGNTTHIVYEAARADPARIIPIKGASHKQDRLIRPSNVAYLRPGAAQKAYVHLHTLDTERLKDILAMLIRSVEPELWFENSLVSPEYVAQMCSEEKMRVRVARKWLLKWIRTSKARNDLWDATVYSLAAAIMMRAHDRAQKAETRRATPRNQPRESSGSPARGKIRRRDGPSKGRRGGDGWIRRR